MIGQRMLQRHLKTVSQKRNQDVRIYAMLQLVVNGANAQLAFQTTEHRLNLRQLHITRPQHGRVFAADIGAQR